jgi:uncharacterized integral membrane protein
MAMTEPPGDGAAPRATNAGRLWMMIAVATVLLILLIIFIAENSAAVTISFLGAHGHIALALALLIAAVAGAIVTLLAGTARILQLRMEVRRAASRNSRPRSGSVPSAAGARSRPGSRSAGS